MKTPATFILIAAAAITAHAQTAPAPSPAPAAASSPAPVSTLANKPVLPPGVREQLKGMTPEQRHEFLKSHPEIREAIREHREAIRERFANMTPEQREQFLAKHPNAAKWIQNAQTKYSGTGANPAPANQAQPATHPNEGGQNKQNRKLHKQQQTS